MGQNNLGYTLYTSLVPMVLDVIKTIPVLDRYTRTQTLPVCLKTIKLKKTNRYMIKTAAI
jgi:hypothetical protein